MTSLRAMSSSRVIERYMRLLFVGRVIGWVGLFLDAKGAKAVDKFVDLVGWISLVSWNRR